MLLCKVTGTLVATRKEPTLDGLKLLVVQPCDVTGSPTGTALVAADAVGAGLGEVVLIAQGSSARQTVATKDRPVDAVIMAIVDTLALGNNVTYQKP
jgi:microcompartment protein CcmK/EutM